MILHTSMKIAATMFFILQTTIAAAADVYITTVN